jgi:predicted RNase H-like HicB family nuclease
MDNYIALIEEDNGAYGAVFPNLPGIVSKGVRRFLSKKQEQ